MKTINDIMPINDNYFIVSFLPNQIIFYNKQTFDCEKKLEIDDNYFGELKKLYLFNKYIITLCEKGIVLILINTKELVQFINYEKDCYNFIN